MKTTTNTLRDRIIEIINCNDYWKLDGDLKVDELSTTLEELFLEEIEKAFDAGREEKGRKPFDTLKYKDFQNYLNLLK